MIKENIHFVKTAPPSDRYLRSHVDNSAGFNDKGKPETKKKQKIKGWDNFEET